MKPTPNPHLTSGTERRQSAGKRIHGSIARDLGVAIVTGRHRPGDGLPGEIEASRQLKVSRTAYREAIRILEAKGLLESLPKAGTRVSARASWHLLDPDILEWMFETDPEDEFIQALFELRLIVEPAAAALAAARRTDAQLERMTVALEEMERYSLGRERGHLADCEFHRTLLQATSNELLETLAGGIEAAVRWTTRYKAQGSAPARDAIPIHASVLEAVRTRDAEGARSTMVVLLERGREDTRAARRELVAARRKSRNTSLPPRKPSAL